jgi:hypothetical protein
MVRINNTWKGVVMIIVSWPIPGLSAKMRRVLGELMSEKLSNKTKTVVVQITTKGIPAIHWPDGGSTPLEVADPVLHRRIASMLS